MKIRIGTRESRLALVQARMVMDAIRRFDPALETELVPMKTSGDLSADIPLDRAGGKGLFTKELDRALQAGRVDLTVHSFKDMPTDIDPALPVVALSKREDPRDALILPGGAAGASGPVGCSSLRRGIQLRGLPEAFATAPVRGNVPTRLEKLDRGEYSALVLAAAGLIRLGLQDRISRYFTPDEILPAACQGIVAVQARAGENTGYLRFFHSEASRCAALAERAFVRALGGGCSSPVAAYAQIEGETLLLRGFYADERTGQTHKGSLRGALKEARALGGRLAEELTAVRA